MLLFKDVAVMGSGGVSEERVASWGWNWGDKNSVSCLTCFGVGDCEKDTRAGKSDAAPGQDLLSGELVTGLRDKVGSSEEREETHK